MSHMTEAKRIAATAMTLETLRARRLYCRLACRRVGLPSWLARDLATDPRRMDVEPWPEPQTPSDRRNRESLREAMGEPKSPGMSAIRDFGWMRADDPNAPWNRGR